MKPKPVGRRARDNNEQAIMNITKAREPIYKLLEMETEPEKRQLLTQALRLLDSALYHLSDNEAIMSEEARRGQYGKGGKQ